MCLTNSNVLEDVAVGNHRSASRSGTSTPCCRWGGMNRLHGGGSRSRRLCREGMPGGPWQAGVEILEEKCTPTAAKWLSRAGLVAEIRASTAQWLPEQAAVVRQAWGQAGKSSWSGSGSLSEVYGKTHGHSSSGKGKEGGAELNKAPRWCWGAPYSLLIKPSPQQPEPRAGPNSPWAQAAKPTGEDRDLGPDVYPCRSLCHLLFYRPFLHWARGSQWHICPKDWHKTW